MPTAVELTPNLRYAETVMGERGISVALAGKIASKGRGTSIGNGKVMFTDDMTASDGTRWSLFVVTQNSKLLTSWAERG